jgi:hypothetical protein
MPRRWRAALAVLLALLLVGMQQEALRHALSHFTPAPAHAQLTAAPSDAPCAACALLAGGAAAINAPSTALAASAAAYVPDSPAEVAPALPPPSFYRSRAPPSLS